MGHNKWCVISNFLFIFPMHLCYTHDLHLFGFVLALQMCLSTYYHFDESSALGFFLDIFGIFLVTTLFFLLWLVSRPTLHSLGFMLTILYGTFALVLWHICGSPAAESYDVVHTGWHILAVYAISVFLYCYIHDTKYTWLCKPLDNPFKKWVFNRKQDKIVEKVDRYLRMNGFGSVFPFPIFAN